MAAKASDVAKGSLQNNKPKSLIQDKSVPNTTKVIGTFLVTYDLAGFRKSCKSVAQACKVDMEVRKKLSEDLLQYVFKANPQKVADFFFNEDIRKQMVLAKSCYREGYQSKKLNKFVVFRDWKSVSGLQAAALCLDKFLIIQLLSYIVGDDNLRLEAKKQLEEIRNRVGKKNEELQKMVISAGNTTRLSATTSNDKNIDRNVAYGKVIDTSADIEDYGAPVKALLKAYSSFLRVKKIYWGSKPSYEGIMEVTKLWDLVGTCHKKLPSYVLQEFFNDISWVDHIDFSLEPPRYGYCAFPWFDKRDKEVDLDDLGDGTMMGLEKGTDGSVKHGLGDSMQSEFDAKAIRVLYECRLTDLENIIDALKTAESALTFLANDEKMRLKNIAHRAANPPVRAPLRYYLWMPKPR